MKRNIMQIAMESESIAMEEQREDSISKLMKLDSKVSAKDEDFINKLNAKVKVVKTLRSGLVDIKSKISTNPTVLKNKPVNLSRVVSMMEIDATDADDLIKQASAKVNAAKKSTDAALALFASKDENASKKIKKLEEDLKTGEKPQNTEFTFTKEQSLKMVDIGIGSCDAFINAVTKLEAEVSKKKQSIATEGILDAIGDVLSGVLSFIWYVMRIVLIIYVFLVLIANPTFIIPTLIVAIIYRSYKEIQKA